MKRSFLQRTTDNGQLTRRSPRIVNSLKAQKNISVQRFGDFITLRFKNDPGDGDDGTSEPAEIMLYDEIGRDPWTGQGVSAQDFANALKAVPKGRDVTLRINSRGGDVHTGLAIHNLIAQHPGRVDAIIDGVAASTASWIPMACDSIEMPESAQMFIHDAMAFTGGNAEDLRQVADQLDKTSDQIARLYADKSGRKADTFRDLMKAETLMTGKEAKAQGLVDSVTKKTAIHNFTDSEMRSMKDRLAAQRNSVSTANPPQNAPANPPPAPAQPLLMNRTQMIALLNRMGVKFDNSATDAQLLELINAIPAPTQLAQAPAAPAQPNPAPTNADPRITALESRITQLTEADNAARKLRIENRIDALISNDQVTKSEREKAIARALKDETYIDELSARPAMPPGGQPLGPSMDIEETGSSFKNVQEYILNNGPRLTSKFLGARNADRPMDRKTATDIRDCAIKSAMAVRKHNKMLVEMFNTNTIDAALQRTVILQELLRAYKLRVLPLRAFCTTFSNVPLEGTDTVTVPYFPLQATASTDWVAGNGYVTGNTTEQMKQVTVNKRKYQGMAFTSYEQRRQPYLNLQQLALMNAEKLAYDVNQDVLSIVTAANYGAAVKTTPAAAFTGDDVADLYGSATDLNWPDTGRSLVLTTGYKVALLKDPTFKQYLAYGATDPVRKAQIQEAYGFEDIYTVPTANFPANGQNLTGFITHKSAALVATAPIMPSPAVRMLMVQYDLVTDPDDGISLEYRLFGDAYFDKTNEIVEANYGYALGVAAALARITSA